jgi:regulation of enolase protein 1 (concanavalin A-like superfamily)
MITAFGENDWQWLNAPRQWTADDGLSLRCDGGTDMWRQTHYGYTTDNAHMFGRTLPGDLRLTLTFSGEYAEQYDQAGAILRIDENNWIKAGIEYVDRAFHLSTVVTRQFSDWSVLPLGRVAERVTFDLERAGDAVTVRYGLDGAPPETMLRLAYFPPAGPAFAGVMSAAPIGKGFPVRFTDVRVTPTS